MYNIKVNPKLLRHAPPTIFPSTRGIIIFQALHKRNYLKIRPKKFAPSKLLLPLPNETIAKLHNTQGNPLTARISHSNPTIKALLVNPKNAITHFHLTPHHPAAHLLFLARAIRHAIHLASCRRISRRNIHTRIRRESSAIMVHVCGTSLTMRRARARSRPQNYRKVRRCITPRNSRASRLASRAFIEKRGGVDTVWRQRGSGFRRCTREFFSFSPDRSVT